MTKRLSHLPSFYSGNSETQIDYILIRRRYFTTVTDCKTVPYEIIAPQHRPLIGLLRIRSPIKQDLTVIATEAEEAIKRMKLRKATGPDDIASELWKAKSWDPLWLSEFFNRVIQEGVTPSYWQESTTVPIWKKIGSPAECSNYRPIRLLSHTMKIFERILDNRIREIVEISMNPAEFVRNCGTTDTKHAVRLLVEKHREKHRPLYVSFLDLEEVFDLLPHELICYDNT